MRPARRVCQRSCRAARSESSSPKVSATPSTSMGRVASRRSSAVSKLVPKVPSVGASRRAAYSASTKRALIDVAETLFTDHGYAATSLDQIVAGARVTKGALYHHFSGKQALFEAVFDRVESDAAKSIQKSLRGERDPWEKAMLGLRAFLEVVREPTYRRVVTL